MDEPLSQRASLESRESADVPAAANGNDAFKRAKSRAASRAQTAQQNQVRAEWREWRRSRGGGREHARRGHARRRGMALRTVARPQRCVRMRTSMHKCIGRRAHACGRGSLGERAAPPRLAPPGRGPAADAPAPAPARAQPRDTYVVVESDTAYQTIDRPDANAIQEIVGLLKVKRAHACCRRRSAIMPALPGGAPSVLTYTVYSSARVVVPKAT